MRAMGLLAWSGYCYDAYAITAFAFVTSVPWAPNTTTVQPASQLPLLDLEVLRDPFATQSAFVAVAAVFACVAAWLLLRPGARGYEVHLGRAEGLPPAMDGLTGVFLFQLCFMPVLRTSLSMTLCDYGPADSRASAVRTNATHAPECYGPEHLAYAGPGVTVALLAFVLALFYVRRVNNVFNPAHRFLEAWQVALVALKAATAVASLFLHTVPTVALPLGLAAVLAGAALNFRMQPHVGTTTNSPWRAAGS